MIFFDGVEISDELRAVLSERVERLAELVESRDPGDVVVIVKTEREEAMGLLALADIGVLEEEYGEQGARAVAAMRKRPAGVGEVWVFVAHESRIGWGFLDTIAAIRGTVSQAILFKGGRA